MDQIYHCADLVVAWLGSESDDSNLALDFIQLHDDLTEQGYDVAAFRTMLQKDAYRLQWTALTNLFARKWWSRIWTVQEFVLARNISFWCGIREMSRLAVCRSLSIADKCTSVGIKETPGFAHANHRRRALDLYEEAGKRKPGAAAGEKMSLSLVALAAYFSCMDSTDERDRLYGLTALASDGHFLDVDYSLDIYQVYLNFAQAFIARHNSLDIICFASIYSPPPDDSLPGGGPSWLPHWQRITPPIIPLMVSQSSKTHIGNLRGVAALNVDPSIQYSASQSRPAVWEFQGSALLARGVVIDTVDGLAGSSLSELCPASLWESAKSSCGSVCTCSATDIITSVCRSLALDRKDRYLRYAMPTAEFLGDFMQLLAPLVSSDQQDPPSSSSFSSSSSTLPQPPKELCEWFYRTAPLQIHGRSFESILHDAYHQPDNISLSPPDDPAPNQDEYYHDTFFGRFFDIVVKMSLRLMVSRHGRLGMVPEKAKKGDVVCILYGCSVPVLLRMLSSERGDDGDGDDGLTLVGECFLDGCMDGSALEEISPEERSFIIR
jgi:hypothetical protein